MRPIPLLPLLLPALVLSLAVFAPRAALAEPSAIYLVRHAEKTDDGKDPALTAQGQARARDIATVLHRAGIAHIFSTPTLRTRQTAQPLATRTGLAVQDYDPRAPQALVDKVRTLEGAVLVVGHSNTLSELVRLFGGKPGAEIADKEYDRLYQLIPRSGGKVDTVLFTSLPATGAL